MQWVGGGMGGKNKIYFMSKNLRVYFIYCIADNRIRLLSRGQEKSAHINTIQLLDINC